MAVLLQALVGGAEAFFNAANIVGICEVIAISVSIILDVRHLDHFTWWGLVWYGLYVVSTWFNLGHRTWGAAVTTCSTVLVGVLLLSGVQCSMLTDAVAQYGPSGYIVGNFFVHYWPCFRLFCFSPEVFWSRKRKLRQDRQPSADVERHFFQQAALGFFPLLVYVSAFRTEEVYGCNVSSRGVFVGTVLVFALNVGIWVWRFRCSLLY